MQLTRKGIVNALLVGTLALGIGSFAQPASAQLDRGSFRELASELDLSRSQMREVGGIMRSLNSDVKDILTSDQFELLKSSREDESDDPQEMWESLDLTDTQAEQLAVVRRDTVVELREILTPDQLRGILEATALDRF